MSQTIEGKLDKFLYLFQIDLLANRFCCGCSLRTGIEIISVLNIIDSLIQLFQPAGSFLSLSLIRFLSLIIVSIGSAYLFLSSNSLNLGMAYKGYFLYVIHFYLDIFCIILSIFLYYYDVYYIHFYTFSKALLSVIAYFMILFFIVAFRLYLLWIVYSYVKYFAKGDIEAINGNSIQDGYVRIDNKSGKPQISQA